MFYLFFNALKFECFIEQLLFLGVIFVNLYCRLGVILIKYMVRHMDEILFRSLECSYIVYYIGHICIVTNFHFLNNILFAL